MRGPVPGSLPVPRRGAQFTHMTRSGAVEAGGTADSGHFYCRAECVVGHAFLPTPTISAHLFFLGPRTKRPEPGVKQIAPQSNSRNLLRELHL